MLAIDTNVVVRYLVRDDVAQFERATSIIENESVFVTPTVVLETEWVLRDFYQLSREQVLTFLRHFCGLATVTVGEALAVERALSFADGGLDFADALHLAQSEGCNAFVTFDKRLERKARGLDHVDVRLA